DNVDPSLIIETEKKLELKKTLFLVISKSGETIETLAQFQYFKDKIAKAKLKEKDHFVFISEKNSALNIHAKKNSCEFFEIPKNIGGRFSAFTAVGLLPTALIGINIKNILDGARTAVENFRTESPTKNFSFILASIQYALSKKGKTINVLFPYCQNLKTINAFYIQLLAESIGKNNKGITPMSAKGATDQHSQLQLFTQGPNDKLFIFIEEENPKNDIAIPNSLANSPFKKPLTFSQLLKIEKIATEQSLNKNSRPNLTIKINELNEKTLGALIMLLFCSISFLGELYGINAYDQPGVKLGKEITKKLLLK
ncbi:MAG: glucose-6-phosphate isomerase, partial [Candidatus Gracilibacteria bacterium]